MLDRYCFFDPANGPVGLSEGFLAIFAVIESRSVPEHRRMWIEYKVAKTISRRSWEYQFFKS